MSSVREILNPPFPTPSLLQEWIHWRAEEGLFCEMGIQISSARYGSLPAVPKSMLALSYYKNKYIKTYVENPSHPSFSPLCCFCPWLNRAARSRALECLTQVVSFLRHYKGTLDIKSMCEVKESCYSPYYRENYSAERLTPRFLNGLLLYFSFLCKNLKYQRTDCSHLVWLEWQIYNLKNTPHRTLLNHWTNHLPKAYGKTVSETVEEHISLGLQFSALGHKSFSFIPALLPEL